MNETAPKLAICLFLTVLVGGGLILTALRGPGLLLDMATALRALCF